MRCGIGASVAGVRERKSVHMRVRSLGQWKGATSTFCCGGPGVGQCREGSEARQASVAACHRHMGRLGGEEEKKEKRQGRARVGAPKYRGGVDRDHRYQGVGRDRGAVHACLPPQCPIASANARM